MKHSRKNITEDQIHQALKNFEKQGRLIRRLPPQEEPPRMLVGARYAAFESLFEVVGLNFI